MNKYAVITGFLGGLKNRYMVFQDNRNITEKFALTDKITGLSGVELCYPEDFEDKAFLKELLAKHNLEISAVNFRCRRTGTWVRGSFTSAIEQERELLLKELKECIDVVKEFGCNRITTCPLNDGHDYIFEMDYQKAYAAATKVFYEAASYAPDMQLCIEYKHSDPRARCFFGSAAETIVFCEQVGLPNVGLTLDFGHSIQANERPAQALVMTHMANRLFHVHYNDNDKFFDWDLLPGSYNFWDSIEFLYYLKHKVKYDGWISFDIMPKEHDTAQAFSVTFALTDKLFAIMDRIDVAMMDDLLEKRNPSETMTYLFSLL